MLAIPVNLNLAERVGCADSSAILTIGSMTSTIRKLGCSHGERSNNSATTSATGNAASARGVEQRAVRGVSDVMSLDNAICYINSSISVVEKSHNLSMISHLHLNSIIEV